MTTKYKVEIETSSESGHTETEFETHDYNELQRFLHLAGMAAEQAPETVEDFNDEEQMEEDYLEPKTYDFTDEQPADYDASPDDYEMVDYNELDPYNDESVYETHREPDIDMDWEESDFGPVEDPLSDIQVDYDEGEWPAQDYDDLWDLPGEDDPFEDEYMMEGYSPKVEKEAEALISEHGVEKAAQYAKDMVRKTKDNPKVKRHWQGVLSAVAEQYHKEQGVSEAIDPKSPPGQVDKWLRNNGYTVRYKDKGKTGRSFKLKTFAVNKDEKPHNPKSEGARNAVEYKEQLKDEIKRDFPEAEVKLTKTWAPGGAHDMWSVSVVVPHEMPVFEDDEDRDDAFFDYGNREVRRQKGRVSQGKQIDAFDYKGREEAGMQRGSVAGYGNNSMQSIQSSNDDLEQGEGELDENCGCGPDCGCPACQEEYGDMETVYVDTGVEDDNCDEHGNLPYGYETDSMGNVVIFNNDDGCSVMLTGEDALEVLTALEQNVEDPRTQQVVMRQYGHMMEDHEITIQRQLRETYKQMVRDLNQ